MTQIQHIEQRSLKKELLKNTSSLLHVLSSHALPTILTTGKIKTPPTSNQQYPKEEEGGLILWVLERCSKGKPVDI